MNNPNNKCIIDLNISVFLEPEGLYTTIIRNNITQNNHLKTNTQTNKNTIQTDDDFMMAYTHATEHATESFITGVLNRYVSASAIESTSLENLISELP